MLFASRRLVADAPSLEEIRESVARDAVITEIRSHNPRASRDWLRGFPSRDLALYLEHLESAREPRGPASAWERPGDTPAIILRTTARDF